MKQTLVLFWGVAILLSASSCQKKTSDNLINQNTSNSNPHPHPVAKSSSEDLGFTFLEMGEMHNAGVGYLITSLANSGYDLDDQDAADTLVHYLFPYLNYNYPSIFTASDSAVCDTIIYQSLLSGDMLDGDSLWQHAKTGAQSLVSSTEMQFITQLDTILNDASALSSSITRDSVLGYIIMRLNSVITTYNNQTWSSGDDGNAAAGVLYIARASAGYWRNDNTNSDPAAFLVQVDAAGYLFGWAKAWLYDQLDTPEARIHAGFGMACIASGMRTINTIL